MKKIVTIVGARPQFIKASALSRAIRNKADIQEVLVHTGQHYDASMSDVFFSDLEIPKPAYSLNIGSASHGEQTGKMLEALEKVLVKERPACVVVYGDTNSTLAGALAAVKMHIQIAHIEAGLRSFNRAMPEEINRILTDHMSSYLFCSTNAALKNLQIEGITKNVIACGDIMYDVALWAQKKVPASDEMIQKYTLNKEQKTVFATVHRAENTDNEKVLRAILSALQILAQSHTVILPVHPRTKAKIKDFGLESLLQGIRITEPMSFFETVFFEQYANVIVTDSGGIQKEAYFHKTPCVTIRTETEWVETVTRGWNVLAKPASTQDICTAVHAQMHSAKTREDISEYGNGTTAEAIIDVLIKSI